MIQYFFHLILFFILKTLGRILDRGSESTVLYKAGSEKSDEFDRDWARNPRRQVSV